MTHFLSVYYADTTNHLAEKHVMFSSYIYGLINYSDISLTQ